MRTEQLIVLQIIAHFLTDYTFQPAAKAHDKNTLGFRSSYLKWHILLAFFLSWIVSFEFLFVIASLVIALAHWVIDGIKVFVSRSRVARYAYFIDQALHLAVIFAVVPAYVSLFGDHSFTPDALGIRIPAIVAGFLFCAKASNVLIKEILAFFEIKVRKTGQEETDLPNAGKLIGVVERWLIIVFIWIGHFEAIGFLLAAKSIMRFKTDESLKTEYLLTGTLLSFSIAIGAGLILQWLVS
jgi:hypothetical protein